MRRVLLDDDPSWSVWLDWYDERLRGDAPDQGRELARATALTLADYEQGAVHMNNRVIEALAEYETKRSPTADSYDISAREKQIVKQRAAPVTEAGEKEVTDRVFFGGLWAEIDPAGQKVLDPDATNDVAMLRAPFAYFQEMVQESESPRVWLTNIDTFTGEVAHLRATGELDTVPFMVRQVVTLIRSHEQAISDRYPRAAAEQNARRLQDQEPLTAETLRAFREIIEQAREALAPEVQEDFDTLLQPAEGDAQAESETVEPTSVANRDRLYRIKAMFLRLRQLVSQSTEDLKKALDVVKDTDEAVKRIERVARAIADLWDKISGFLI